MGVTLVIPTKNEAATLQAVLESSMSYADETIVVDGGSSDGSKEIATAFGARVLVDSGDGKGAGLRLAIEEAGEDTMVFMDADGSHDPGDIPRLVAALQDRDLDLVIGSRIRGGSDEWSGSFGRFVRMMGSHMILIAINYRWGIRLTDCQNGFRAIRTDVARRLGLKEKGFAIEQEMVMRCLIHGCRVGEIGCHEYERRGGASKLNLVTVWPDILRTLIMLSLQPRREM